LEGVIFNALVSCREDRLLIPLRAIADTVNFSTQTSEPLSSKTVGSVVGRLGFKKRRKSDGVYVVWNDAIYERLLRRYTLIKIKKEEPKDVQPHI
jgi:hypothetical protein